MNNPILVVITPTSNRAKNRVHEHGKVMELIEDQGHRFAVRSLKKTFLIKGGEPQTWAGWFDAGEATFQKHSP